MTLRIWISKFICIIFFQNVIFVFKCGNLFMIACLMFLPDWKFHEGRDKSLFFIIASHNAYLVDFTVILLLVTKGVWVAGFPK